MRKKFTMLLASLFLVMGTSVAQVYQKVLHKEWTVTAPNQSGTSGNEGGVAFIRDENPMTFYHSDWGSIYEGRSAKKGADGLQGFMIDMGSVLYDITKITYTGRSDNNTSGWARKVRIYLYTKLPEGIPADLSTLTTYEAKENLFSKDNATLGTAAFDNNETGEWADNRNLKTAEFAEVKSARYVLFIMDSGHDNWLTCADFNVWQKVEGIVEDKPYFLKINGLDGNFYLDTRVGEGSNYGNTICKTTTPVATYFTLRDGYWHISSFPGHEKHFVNVANWDAKVGQDTPANWYLYKDKEHSLWSLAQSAYNGDSGVAYHYLGANGGNISGNSKVYTDKTIEQAVKFELVELDEKQTAAEAARVALSYTGVGYPAADSEARTTLQAAIDAADATVESINAAIAAYQANTQTVQMPEVGKVYRLVSALPGFKTKKAIYSDNIELKWKDRDATAMNQLWTVVSISGKNAVLMNVGDAIFPQKSDFGTVVSVSTTKNECSLEFLGKGQFQIKANKLQGMHANNHGGGTGTSGNIINYNTGADGASAWYFEEVAVTKDVLEKQIKSIENTYTGSLLIKQEGVSGLQTAVDDARTNADYAAAIANLAKAVDEAEIENVDLAYIYMKSRKAQKYAYNDNESLKVTDSKSSPKAIFKLTKTNNGTYYVQNGNGLYAQGVNTSQLVNTSTSAVEYTITRLSSGYYVLRPTSSTNVQGYWHDANNGTGNIVGWGTDAENTQWAFESLTAEELEKIYVVKEFSTNGEGVYVTYKGTYAGDADVKQAGGFYVLDEAPTAEDFTISNIERGKVFVNGNSLYVCEGYDAANIYTLRSMSGNSYARYHSGSKLSAEDETNMLTYENNNLHFESLFFIEEGEDDYKGYYTIRSVAAPTMYAYNLSTADANSTVAMKEAPAEGDLTGAYYWKISNFGSKETSNITPWGEGGDAFGWNKRGSYNGYNHIGYWKDYNTYNDNKWYVNIVKDELVEKFIPLHTVSNSVIGYATYESVEAVLPYTEVVTAEGINKLKNAQFNVVAPQVGKYYRLKNEVSGLYMSGDESNITLVEKEHQVSTIFYLDENYALKSHNTGRYLDCDKKDYADGDNKPAGTFGFAYGGMKPNVITYKNNDNWTFGANSKGDNKLDRGSNTPNAAGYNWILEEGDVDVWEAKAELVSLMEESEVSPLPLQVEDANGAYYLSATQQGDAPIAKAIDNDPATYYGSTWGSIVGSRHYWQVDLGDGVTLSEFVFSYITRANGSDTPTRIDIKGSADGSTFTDIVSLTKDGNELPNTGGATYISEVVENPNNYRYIRFEVPSTTNNYSAAGNAEQEVTIAIAEFVMWGHAKVVMLAAQTVVDNKAATLDEVNQAYLNLKMMNVEKPTYPFTVTTDDENPVLYAIKSGRTDDGKEWWYTYDSEDRKIALSSQYAGSDNQFWFFKEVITDDYQYALQLYPYIDKTKAMSYEDTNDAAAKIVAQTLGTEGWTNLWLLASTDDKAPYGLQTYDKKNYLSNNGGVGYKMGMWNAAPNKDGGTAMYFYTLSEALQNLIGQAKVLAVSGHDGEVGYYTAETANALRAAIAQGEANLENKDYSVVALNEAITALELILPESGKYYQIHSGLQAFAETKAIYSTGSASAWKSLDGSDKSFYWTITPNGEGTSFTFRNVGDNGYLNGVTIVTKDTVTTTLKFLAPGEFNIISNGNTLHAESHGSGSGVSGNIINHGGGANGASSWKIIEVEDPDLATAKAALQNRVDELNGIVDNMGFAIGQNKATDRDELLEYLTIAQGVLDSGSSVPADYDTALNALNESVSSLDYSIIFPQVGNKLVIKNKQHNTYFGVKLEGGKLDNSIVPTKKLLWGYTSDSGYNNCWELVSAIHNETACFYFYNPYYDWYASPIAGRNAEITLTKTTDGAGCYQIEFNGNYFVIKCLNGTDTGHVYLHQVDWTSNGLGYPVVDWNAGADASQWSIELVSDDTENGWLETLSLEANNMSKSLEIRDLGDGIGQYTGMTTDEKVAMLAALAVPTEGTVSEKIKSLVYALYGLQENINSLVLNMPTVGFYRVKSMNANDENKRGKYWQVNSEASAMELSATAHDFNSIVYLGDDNTLLSYGSGLYLNNYTVPVAVGTEATAWTISKNNEVVGTYALYRSEDGYCLSDWTGSATYGQNDGNAAWIFEEVTSLPVAISNAKVTFNGATKCVSTLFTPVALEVPTGITAYIGVNEDNSLAMEPIAGVGEAAAIIPANTGVILMADAAGTYNFTISSETGTAIEPGDNIIAGTVAKTIITPAANTTYYVLANGYNGVGLYKAKMNRYDNGSEVPKEKEDGTRFLNNACKAYIPVTGGQNAPALVMRFGRGQGTTEIELPTANGQQPTAVYDLQGRRVLNPTKGMYIINGKKVVIR